MSGDGDSSTTSSAGDGSTSKDKIPAFSEIRVIEVNRDNFAKIWPYLLVCIKSADFTAIDLELSGLGGKGLRSRDIAERYQAIRDAAHTRYRILRKSIIFSLKNQYFYLEFKKSIFS